MIISGTNIKRRAEVINKLIEDGLLPTNSNLYSCKPFFLSKGFPMYTPKEAEYNGFMTEFTPPTGSFLDEYRQSLNLGTKLKTEQIDLSQ